VNVEFVATLNRVDTTLFKTVYIPYSCRLTNWYLYTQHKMLTFDNKMCLHCSMYKLAVKFTVI